jgi:3-hydroxymyristoyl/3-hydroxydecanoyl-(acyl carrier protein) dehydratase
MIVDPIVVDCRIRASGAAVELVVPEDLHYFRGHFPGMPIVPGVVQIKWAISLARLYLRAGPAFRGMEALKFQQVMRPGARVTLDLEYADAAGKLRFSFGSEPARYSSGRLILRAVP